MVLSLWFKVKGMIKNFWDLEIWKMGEEIVKEIYKITSTKRFLKDFTLRDQIKGSTISIVSNIAEGFGRKGNKEFINFLYIANGSLCELQAQLLVAKDLNYIERETFVSLFERLNLLQKRMGALIKYLRTSTFRGEKYKNSKPRTKNPEP